MILFDKEQLPRRLAHLQLKAALIELVIKSGPVVFLAALAEIIEEEYPSIIMAHDRDKGVARPSTEEDCKEAALKLKTLKYFLNTWRKNKE